MEIERSGLKLLVQQYKALLWKNLLLSWRNKGATLVRLIAPFFFFLLVFFIQTTAKASYGSLSSNMNLKNPPGLVSPPIPPCEDKFFIKLPCFDFVWSGNDSYRVHSIIGAIMDNNPGRSIPSSKVKSFKTVAEVDAWLNVNPMRTPGGMHFSEKSGSVISYGLQINSTAALRRGVYEDPTFKFQIPLQIAAEREITRSLLRVPNFSWAVTIKEFAHPAMEILSALDSAGPASFLATAMFNFVFQMTALISEKETNLRQAMTMMGLYDSAYWLSWLTFDTIFAFVSTLLIVLFGLVFQFEIFLRNSFVVVFLVFFLFQLSMLGFAYMLSSLISMSSSSTTVGFSIFIIGTMTQLVTVFGFPYSHGISKLYQITWSLFPPNLLAKALLLLSQAIPSSHDISTGWGGQIAGENCSASDHGQCVMTMSDVCLWLLITFFFWIVCAIYLDNIVPNPFGARKSMFYFLNPQYWTGKGGYNVEEGGVCSCTRACNEEGFLAPDDEDVAEEERMVKAQTRNQVEDSGVAVHIRGLSKTYPKATEIGCFRCKKTPSHHALKELWLNVDKGQLFCLLGPNGAGKTTTINCLTGFTRVAGGDAFVYGNSVRSSIGMSNIRKTIGVCPQFDILWESLTGQDHLNLFACIKGINPGSIASVIENLLAETGLNEAARLRAGSYCGGMKRRLSVAIALIGDPKLVILDEPTTGADPIARRKIWDIIENAKRGRAIILTTHSMEEADILGDRIGIMTDGRLRCIGTSIRLKLRYGAGFIVHVSFIGDLNDGRANRDAVKEFFKHKLGVVPKKENSVYITFVTPHDKEILLPNFYAELQERAIEFGVVNIQLGLTTLHEVFLNIAAKNSQQETESAQRRIDTEIPSPESLQRIGGRLWGRSRTCLNV